MNTTSIEFKNQIAAAREFFRAQGRVSVGAMQRKLQIGFARAVTICDELVKSGDLIHLINGLQLNLSNNDINRFVSAQKGPMDNYAQALKEIEAGEVTSYWIWYVFPQFRAFGYGETAVYYGIADRGEAERYLEHPILGARIREISKELLKHKGKSATEIFGSLDAQKVCSCMTMFDFLSPNDVFAAVLDTFYNGERDRRALKEVSKQ